MNRHESRDIAEEEPGSVSITTLLDVFGTLRHRYLLPFRHALADQYSDIAREAIEETISTGFGQPFTAIATLASYWSEKSPSTLTDILDRLPEPPAALLLDDGFKASISEIYIHGAALIAATNPTRAEQLRKSVLTLLSNTKTSNSFFEHLRVRALIGLGQFSTALELLNLREGGDAAWKNVWLATVFDGLGRTADCETSRAEALKEANTRDLKLWMVEERTKEILSISTTPMGDE